MVGGNEQRSDVNFQSETATSDLPSRAQSWFRPDEERIAPGDESGKQPQGNEPGYEAPGDDGLAVDDSRSRLRCCDHRLQ
jgi:hypothetical protein